MKIFRFSEENGPPTRQNSHYAWPKFVEEVGIGAASAPSGRGCCRESLGIFGEVGRLYRRQEDAQEGIHYSCINKILISIK